MCKGPAGGGGWRKYCCRYGVLVFLEQADADFHPFRNYNERAADAYAVMETAYLTATSRPEHPCAVPNFPRRISSHLRRPWTLNPTFDRRRRMENINSTFPARGGLWEWTAWTRTISFWSISARLLESAGVKSEERSLPRSGSPPLPRLVRRNQPFQC
ncbi:hypothetical protein ARMGADRAFT_117204 [Armillaria gallica]|uniref:Uncharacterized protein n=1 Tax=Armillaria gallica TaxID=47427 RepID=A0A2H3DG14_ARMGA|nr:hypothetical protein ARMGADRAFT_117204 [Armillaria gallica]